jgi:hypothetical protein
MPQPKKPFYISFTHDNIPQRVDHSRSQLGPSGATANRAGHTTIQSRARLTAAWDDGPTGVDGRVPIFARSINVYFQLADFLIAISSDFAVQSCAYRETRRHELEAHVYDPIRIFYSYRDVLVLRLNAIVVPTKEAPLRVASGEMAARKAEVEGLIVNTIGQTRRELLRDLQQASDRHDSADSYRLVYNHCTDAQWASGR